MSKRKPKQDPNDLPTPLPVGRQEFEDWSNYIIELAGQFADVDSMKYALATTIINLKPDVSSVPNNYFVNCLRKAAANQVASVIFQEIRQKHAEDEAKRKAEATAQLSQVADAAPENNKEV